MEIRKCLEKFRGERENIVFFIIFVILTGIPIILMSIGEREISERYKRSVTKLQGNVFSESLGSREYFFSMDTKLGRKYIQVIPARGSYMSKKLNKIDLMIEPGTKVEIEIAKTELNQSDYKLYADEIRVLSPTKKNLEILSKTKTYE